MYGLGVENACLRLKYGVVFIYFRLILNCWRGLTPGPTHLDYLNGDNISGQADIK